MHLLEYPCFDTLAVRCRLRTKDTVPYIDCKVADGESKCKTRLSQWRRAVLAQLDSFDRLNVAYPKWFENEHPDWALEVQDFSAFDLSRPQLLEAGYEGVFQQKKRDCLRVLHTNTLQFSWQRYAKIAYTRLSIQFMQHVVCLMSINLYSTPFAFVKHLVCRIPSSIMGST